jgi:putative ABC transport system permease protein
MLSPRFIPLVLKQAFRRTMRTLLTVAGVATAMFMFAAVDSLQKGVDHATKGAAEDTRLIVYRENRFCPATSRLPESYGDRIARIPGVASVLPMKVVPTNCRTSLDVITFRGVPAESWSRSAERELSLTSGSLAEWTSRMDAALLGEALASRRGLKVGDRIDAAGVRVYVAGVISSDKPQEQNVAYVHLDFLQRTTGQRALGIVTQFNVKVTDPAWMDSIAGEIDAMFKDDQQPTQTSSEKGFVARAASDIISLVAFMRYMGWGCLAAVLALVGNSIVLSVQDRICDHAVMQTLGYSGGLIARLVVAEGLLLGTVGGLLGTALAVGIAHWWHFSISSEGLTIPVQATAEVMLQGVVVAAALGIAAGLVPAWQVSRRPIAQCFRAV